LFQAFNDMTCEYGNRQWQMGKNVIQAQARGFLTRHSPELHMVCEMAGIHPDAIIARARYLASKPIQSENKHPVKVAIKPTQLELFAIPSKNTHPVKIAIKPTQHVRRAVISTQLELFA